jgi:hypothetical protein
LFRVRKKRNSKSNIFSGEKMKNRKWLTYTLGILLTLVVLGVVGAVGYRIGTMQNATFVHPSFTQNFDGGAQTMPRSFQNDGMPPRMQENFHNNGGPQGMQANPHNQGFDNRGNNRGFDRRGGRSFFPPIFGLIHLALLGLLLWVVYKLVKNSGWRLTRVAASPAPTVSATPSAESVEVEEKKESE